MCLINVVEKHFADKIDINRICMVNSCGETTTAYTTALANRIVHAVYVQVNCIEDPIFRLLVSKMYIKEAEKFMKRMVAVSVVL